jgi:hypothetical protein
LLEQFATKLEPRLAVVGLAIGLAELSTFLCGVAYFRWKANEIAMRHDRALPSTIAVPLLALAAALVSGIIAAVEWLKSFSHSGRRLHGVAPGSRSSSTRLSHRGPAWWQSKR